MQGLDDLLKRNGFYSKDEMEQKDRDNALIIDPMRVFIDEMCIRDTDATIKKNDLLNHYNDWATFNGLLRMTNARRLKKKLEFYDVEEERIGNKNIPTFIGIRYK